MTSNINLGASSPKISTDQAYIKLMRLSTGATEVKGTETSLQGSSQNLGAVGTQQIAQMKTALATLENYSSQPAAPDGYALFSSLPPNIQEAATQLSNLYAPLYQVVSTQQILLADRAWMGMSVSEIPEVAAARGITFHDADAQQAADSV